MTPTRPAIGLFDSGIGGLTVAREVARQLPHEDILYLGDTARLPYGTKSPETVIRYAEKALSALLQRPLKAVVIACNTASAHALHALRAKTDLTVLGVIHPGARAAAQATRSGRIGIAGTEATVASAAYQNAIADLLGTSPQQVVAHAWPLLVPLAEEGWITHPVARLTLETYLQPFIDSGVDTLVLGCTHYPLFKPLILDILEEKGHPMALVDSAEALTAELRAQIPLNPADSPLGHHRFLCTDAPERFERVGATFFGHPVASVTKIDL